jgi:hypothetical protein
MTTLAWPGRMKPSIAPAPRSSRKRSAGGMSRSDGMTRKLSGGSAASEAAIGAAVV